jgi:hypothetical protein
LRILWDSWLPAGLLVGCLASFTWACPDSSRNRLGSTGGKRVISVWGAMCGIQHLFVILFISNLTAERSLAGSVLYIGSAGLFWWAIKTSLSIPLSAAFSPDLPTHLVANGPCRMMKSCGELRRKGNTPLSSSRMIPDGPVFLTGPCGSKTVALWKTQGIYK